MERPSPAVLAFALLVGTCVASMLTAQLCGVLKKGELVREAPLPPLTRANHPIVFWGFVGIGTAAAMAIIFALVVVGGSLLTA